MKDKIIRFKQRFQHFHKAYIFFEKEILKDNFTPLEVAGIIKTFEFTFELAWKTLKDFLEGQGLNVNYPRDTIKESFKKELIEDGHLWLQMLDARNFYAHIYDERETRNHLNIIKSKYFPAIKQVYNKCLEINKKID